MTTDLNALRQSAEKILGLREKATPGPWSLDTVDTSAGTCHRIGPFPSNGARKETHACVYADNIRKHDYGQSKTGDELLANAQLMHSIHQACDTLAAMLPLIERCERLEAALRTIASGTADSAPPYRGLGTSGPVRDIAVAALATPPEDANHDKT